MEHDLFGPSFARRSGLREGGKQASTPDQVRGRLFPDHALPPLLLGARDRVVGGVADVSVARVDLYSVQHRGPQFADLGMAPLHRGSDGVAD